MKFILIVGILLSGTLALADEVDFETALNKLRANTTLIYFINPDLSFGFCTGVIVDVDRLITAAHCFYDKQNKKRSLVNFKVYTGLDNSLNSLPDGQFIEIKHVSIHPGFSGINSDLKNVNFDIAIIELKEKLPIVFEPLKLISSQNDMILIDSQQPLLSGGFAFDNSNLITFKSSSKIPLELTSPNFKVIQLTGLTTDMLPGNSGGPLIAIINNSPNLIGIASGYNKGDSNKFDPECFNEGIILGLDFSESPNEWTKECFFQTFANISQSLDWIKTELQ